MQTSDEQPEAEKFKTIECRRHGEYVAEHLWARIFSPCPKCCDEAEADRKTLDSALEATATYDPQAARISAAGITKRFENATLDSFIADNPGQRAALSFARGYVADFKHNFRLGRSVMLLGRPGTGKTHLAMAILRALLEASPKFEGKLVSVSDVFRRIKASWEKGSRETEAEAIAYFTKQHLLVIDEVGVQFGSQTEMNLLYEVVNARYIKMLPTILISNLSPERVKEVVGLRVFDRLCENGGESVIFNWNSQRTC